MLKRLAKGNMKCNYLNDNICEEHEEHEEYQYLNLITPTENKNEAEAV